MVLPATMSKPSSCPRGRAACAPTMSSVHRSVATTNVMALLQCLLPVKADAGPLAAVILKTAPCLGSLPPAVRPQSPRQSPRKRARQGSRRGLPAKPGQGREEPKRNGTVACCLRL
mmetsp:Transcript_15072/g.45544  ORF Transcript_15072/g.45544 Transcript_15072/m.45544 type:complete len:116 (-) Transcript_15072:193-540(-)